MATQTFIPRVTPNARAIIKSKSDETYFIMEQRQPESMYDPLGLDLQPHCIRSIGTYDEINKWWEALVNRIEWLHREEKVEIFSRGEGSDFLNLIVFKGTEVITLTVCTKEKALALAL